MSIATKSRLTNSVELPILTELIPDGIEFGTNLLVEFEPDSIWYDASLTMAAQALRNGIKTDYHTFQRDPSEVSRAISRFGLDVQKLHEDGLFRLIDSYTVQTKLAEPERPKNREVIFLTQSVHLADWSIGTAQAMKTGMPELERKRFHIADDTSVLLQYNAEKAFIDFWRTRAVPTARAAELAFVYSAIVGVHSQAFYKQFESLSDGIIEFKREETAGTTNQLARVKIIRGRKHDPQWHRLTVAENHEVILEK